MKIFYKLGIAGCSIMAVITLHKYGLNLDVLFFATYSGLFQISSNHLEVMTTLKEKK